MTDLCAKCKKEEHYSSMLCLGCIRDLSYENILKPHRINSWFTAKCCAYAILIYLIAILLTAYSFNDKKVIIACLGFYVLGILLNDIVYWLAKRF